MNESEANIKEFEARQELISNTFKKYIIVHIILIVGACSAGMYMTMIKAYAEQIYLVLFYAAALFILMYWYEKKLNSIAPK